MSQIKGGAPDASWVERYHLQATAAKALEDVP